METVLNLSLSIASIYIRHPIICQSCPDMSDDKTVRRQSGFHNKSDNKVGDFSRRPESKSSRPIVDTLTLSLNLEFSSKTYQES